MRGWLLAGAIISTATGSGCALFTPEVRHVAAPLSRPERPVLPRVTEAELQCLSDDAYRRLVERERLRREYAEEMEAIIDSTRETRQ